MAALRVFDVRSRDEDQQQAAGQVSNRRKAGSASCKARFTSTGAIAPAQAAFE
jgi:hypothetical protein